MSKSDFSISGQIDSNKDVVSTSELIKYLEGHIEAHGDTQVHFEENGNDEVEVKFRHYRNALVIEISETL